MNVNRIITPSELWKDFESRKETEILYRAEKGEEFGAILEELLFRAWSEEDGDLDVAARLYIPKDAKDVIVLAEDTEGIERMRELEKTLGFGFAVLVVDYSDVHDWGTKFPDSLSYGVADKRGDRMERFETSPHDSCQFLYARILSRAVGLAKSLFPEGKTVALALGDSAEFCIQSVAMDKRPDGLIIVGGNIYDEYNDLNRYDEQKPELNPEQLVWMTSVAAVAYVKHLACPVLSVSGSNSLVCDPDRLESFFAGMPDGYLTVLVRAGERTALDSNCFATVSKWLEGIRNDRRFPLLPDVEIKVYQEGSVGAAVKADPSSMIESVVLYYAFGEKNRRFRYYKKRLATCVSMDGEYMANFDVQEGADCAFAYATVNYLHGLSVSSFMQYEKIDRKNNEETVRHNVVLSGSDSYDEFEIDRNAFILVDNEKLIVTTGLGLKGVSAKNGGLRTFALNDDKVNKNASILQIDFYSEKKKTVRMEVETWEDGALAKYMATAEIGGSVNAFVPVRLVAGDFKTKDRIPLENFDGIKSLSVLTPAIGVGNILFV